MHEPYKSNDILCNKLISKNQALQILYLKHIKLRKLPWIETHENLIPIKLNNDTVQFYCYIAIVNGCLPAIPGL